MNLVSLINHIIRCLSVKLSVQMNIGGASPGEEVLSERQVQPLSKFERISSGRTTRSTERYQGYSFPEHCSTSLWEFGKRSMCRPGANNIKFIEIGEAASVRYHHSSAQLFEIVEHELQKPRPTCRWCDARQHMLVYNIYYIYNEYIHMKADKAFESLFRFMNISISWRDTRS